MATVVCQGSNSLFVDPPLKAEPPLLPPASPVTLRLKLSPAKPAANLGGWGFLHQSAQESASDVGRKDGYAPREYSSVRLSERSLQLCTENLGSETGAIDVIEGDDSILSHASEFPKMPSSGAVTRHHSGGRKVNPPREREIPPPLTSLRGSESIQVTARREEGRLVINAVKSPSKIPCFLAERSDGRLRLCLLRSTETPDVDQEITHKKSQKPEAEPRDYHERQPVRLFQEHDKILPVDTNTEILSHGEADARDRDGEITAAGSLIERRIIRIRCKEGEPDHHRHHRHHHQNKMMLLNWEPLWVATS